MGIPHFLGENQTKFRVWRTMVHQQGSAFLYVAHIDMLILRQAEAPQSIKRIDTCRIHRETSVTG